MRFLAHLSFVCTPIESSVAEMISANDHITSLSIHLGSASEASYEMLTGALNSIERLTNLEKLVFDSPNSSIHESNWTL